jgi:uncharacterized protein involved in exopolysaccharide biosynthesis
MEKRSKLSSSEMREKNRFTIFDMKYMWAIFTSHKKWFVLSVISCLFLAVTYLYLNRPSYNIAGKMMIIDRRQNSSGISSSTALLNQLPLSLGSSLNLGRSLNVENEKEVIKTKLLAKDVVEDLGLYTEIRLQKFLRSHLLYKNQPVNVIVSPEILQVMNENQPQKIYSIKLTIDKSDAGYTVEGKLKKGKKKVNIEEQTFAKLPAVLHTEIGDLTFTENNLPTEEDRKPFKKDYRLKVNIQPPMMVAKQYYKRLTVAPTSKKVTSILQINLKDEHMIRGIDFVNCLVTHYNNRSNQYRQEEAAKNEEFINGRIAKIDEELGLTDADWEKVKKQYQVTDPKVDVEEVMGKKSTYESQIVNFGVQQQLLDYLSEYVNDPANLYELIPVNVGVYSGDAVSMISRHNQLVNERKMLLKSVTEQSTQVKLTTQLIDELHPVIQTAFKRDRESLLLRKRVAEREYNRYMSRVENVPEQERNMTEVSRQRNIKQSVFASLLQKREQVAMELANTVDKGRLIEETLPLTKTNRKSLMALLLSPVFGMILPYAFFFSRRSLKKQINSDIDLKVTTKLPLVGTIPALGQADCDDAFRVIRNNLLQQLKDGQKTILITSANKGDGKTFCATHLADTFTWMGENTISCHLLDILPAGMPASIHPADQLAHKGLQQALTSLRETYDIIILDGPEIDQGNGALIGGLADVTCFVCPLKKTSKATIQFLDKLKKENQMSSLCIILNE